MLLNWQSKTTPKVNIVLPALYKHMLYCFAIIRTHWRKVQHRDLADQAVNNALHELEEYLLRLAYVYKSNDSSLKSKFHYFHLSEKLIYDHGKFATSQDNFFFCPQLSSELSNSLWTAGLKQQYRPFSAANKRLSLIHRYYSKPILTANYNGQSDRLRRIHSRWERSAQHDILTAAYNGNGQKLIRRWSWQQTSCG